MIRLRPILTIRRQQRTQYRWFSTTLRRRNTRTTRIWSAVSTAALNYGALVSSVIENRPLCGTAKQLFSAKMKSDTDELIQDVVSSKEVSSSSTDANLPSVEETYSRISPLEHILLRPGMYIGPTERVSERCFLVDEATVDNFRPTPTSTLARQSDDEPILLGMVRRTTDRIPALLKVFDEILVNASDNRLRTHHHSRHGSASKVMTTTKINVVIDQGCPQEGRQPYIGVRNNGKGIPIQIHKTEGLYIPEMVFGHLLTGSNFDDESKRLTGTYVSLYATVSQFSFNASLIMQRSLNDRQPSACVLHL